jgi:hypothetical protein
MRTKKYAHIYNITIDEFLTHIPPCKECLIQPMCMFMGDYFDKNELSPKLFIKACEGLDKFMKGKKCFRKLYGKKQNRI